MKATEIMTASRTLRLLFAASLALAAFLIIVPPKLGIKLIDTIADPAHARAVIAAMTDSQKVGHIWMTATADVAFAFAYGFLFAGMALRFFGPRTGRILASLMIVCLLIDLAEGAVQILALMGSADLLASKIVLTPAKYGLALLGIILSIAGPLLHALRKPASR